jgi:hypothetical protein
MTTVLPSDLHSPQTTGKEASESWNEKTKESRSVVDAYDVSGELEAKEIVHPGEPALDTTLSNSQMDPHNWPT